MSFVTSTSCTTTVVTPITTRVSAVTSTVSTSVPFSIEMYFVPTGNGKYGLSIVVEKSAGSIVGA